MRVLSYPVARALALAGIRDSWSVADVARFSRVSRGARNYVNTGLRADAQFWVAMHHGSADDVVVVNDRDARRGTACRVFTLSDRPFTHVCFHNGHAVFGPHKPRKCTLVRGKLPDRQMSIYVYARTHYTCSYAHRTCSHGRNRPSCRCIYQKWTY